MKNRKKAYIFAITAIGFWSTVASAFKLTLRHMTPEFMILYSSLFSLAVLALIIIIQGKSAMLFSSRKKELLMSALLGTLNPFLYYILLFRAYSLLPAQEAMTLNYIWPIMLMLLSVPLLGERLSPVSIFAALISFSGVAVIATGGDITGLNFSNAAGVALALSSSVVWALFWLLGVRDRRDETVTLFTNFLFGTVYIIIYIMISGDIVLPPLPGITGCIYIGLFEMGITFVAWSLALRYAENTASISNLVFLSPFMSLLLISVVVGEKITLSTVSGLVLIIAGIIIQNRFSKN
ncbi:MAG TPA: DMT family transporter [Spirochaetota bacterium]|nr:DMT family transporter [Spirochaetota bacterium]